MIARSAVAPSIPPRRASAEMTSRSVDERLAIARRTPAAAIFESESGSGQGASSPLPKFFGGDLLDER